MNPSYSCNSTRNIIKLSHNAIITTAMMVTVSLSPIIPASGHPTSPSIPKNHTVNIALGTSNHYNKFSDSSYVSTPRWTTIVSTNKDDDAIDKYRMTTEDMVRAIIVDDDIYDIDFEALLHS